MVYRLATLALAPLLYFQGSSARRSIPRLPEPPGERQGSTGSGPRLRLLVFGDSAAAGVGAAHQDEALLGRLVEALSVNFTVEWHLVAKTGATTASALVHLQSLEAGPFDIAITSLGVNDVTAGITTKLWLAQQAELRETLRTRFGVAHLIVSGLPPLHGFPALPQPLRWYLGSKAQDFDQDLRRALDAADGVWFLSLRFTEDARLMAADGFHPGPEVYREWARRASVIATCAMQSMRPGHAHEPEPVRELS